MIKKILIDKANRTYQFPPDIFSFLPDNDKPSLIKKTELIDLGKINWNVDYDDKTALSHSDLQEAKPVKIDKLKEAIADWIYELHHIKINPKNEIFIGGSKSDILFSTALAYIDPNDLVFVPELGSPIYRKITTAAGGEPISYSLSSKTNWKPDFRKLSTRIGHVSKLLYLNSPHNPTGYSLGMDEFEDIVSLASKENIAIINDSAYQTISDTQNSSLIGTKKGKRIGLEIYSFPYQFGIPQIPFGFAVGNKEMIEGLAQSSTLLSSFLPNYYVDLALEGIRKFPSENISTLQKQYSKTKLEAEKLFELLQIESNVSSSMPYIWGKLSKRKSANKFAIQLFRKYRILSVPGTVFGNIGEGFIRLSLTATPSDYQEAYKRIQKKLSLLNKGLVSDD